MVEFMEIIKKNSTVQNKISKTIEKIIIDSYATQSKLGQCALIQSKVFEQATNKKRKTLEDTDIEVKQKDIKIEFLENKIGSPDSEVIEEMNKLGINKISSKKSHRSWIV